MWSSIPTISLRARNSDPLRTPSTSLEIAHSELRRSSSQLDYGLFSNVSGEPQIRGPGLNALRLLPVNLISNTEYYRDNILAALIQFVPAPGGRQLVIHADNARPSTANNDELFVRKMGGDSLHIRPPHLISHPRISSSWAIARTTCGESTFNQRENYSRELGRDWVRSRSRVCSASPSTGWRDSNGFLRIMVVTIHKLNIL
jgi:hypothetical protein